MCNDMVLTRMSMAGHVYLGKDRRTELVAGRRGYTGDPIGSQHGGWQQGQEGGSTQGGPARVQCERVYRILVGERHLHMHGASEHGLHPAVSTAEAS